MAYSDATRVTEATARMTTTDSVKTGTVTAVNAFGDAMETIFTTYGLDNQDKQAFRDKLIDLCRYLDHCLQ